VKVKRIPVYGQVIDGDTRCKHYHSPRDIVAIKFRCCKKYYPCYQCHNEAENHKISIWGKEDYETRVILCGVCQYQLTIYEYKNVARCPQCESELNPYCSQHFHLYFEL